MRYQIPLNKWDFSIEPLNYHEKVTIPHTWNVTDEVMKYRGIASYKTDLFIDPSFKNKRVFLSFQAVYHTAQVYINDSLAGSHKHSGFTPFRIEVTDWIHFGETNTIQVNADNTHIDEMLPQDGHFDWADDGGMIRNVSLQFMENDAIEYMQVSETFHIMDAAQCSGTFHIQTAFFDKRPHDVVVSVIDYHNNHTKIQKAFPSVVDQINLDFQDLLLWNIDAPHLYRIVLETGNDRLEQRIGLRSIEVKGEQILLNQKEIYLKGCEWMPGSHPDFGMAEPFEHSIFRLRQLKNAGCIFTRFHWQQDDSLFDWCDENGLLVQEEIPYWGFPKEATPLQLTIAKQQASEMVYFHSQHPSIIFWGVGNELGAHCETTIQYVEDMKSYFKSLDSMRLVNYVSNTLSLVSNIDKDDATLHGDVAMWNDYLGLWEPSDDIENHAIRTAKKAKGMPLIVSEFGLCEPHFTGGDPARYELLQQRIELYNKIENIKGYVWFSLNDYRTHCGEAGEDKFRQRIHGSTDLYGNEKPSYRLLCSLPSPF